MRRASIGWVIAGSVVALTLAACDPQFLSRFRAAFRAQIGSPSDGQTCGESSDFAGLVPDCPFEGVCFTSACEAHDLCYSLCQGTREECDRRFRSDLFALCNSQFALDDPGLRECLYFANLYWAVVDAEGGGFYDCDFVPTQPRPGACCRAGAPPACEEVENQSACGFQSVFFADLSCKDVTETFGGCPAPGNDACEDRVAVCRDQTPEAGLGRCDAADVGDPNVTNRVCSLSSQDCVLGDACLPREGDIYRCTVQGDNRLASTDGPDPGQACGFEDAGRFQADIWFEYRAPCTGTMTVQMCNGTFYDAVLAIYGSDDPAAECACPDEAAAPLACNDDGCGAAANPSIASAAVVEGGCYVLRVGGWSRDALEGGAARGVSRLDIGVLCGEGRGD